MAAQESYLLGNLGNNILKRIEMVEAAAALNEAQNRVEKAIEKKKRLAKQKKKREKNNKKRNK